MTEEEMLRSGLVCKDCHKEHYGQVCPCNKCGWIHPHHGLLDRPFTPENVPTITEVPPEDSKTKEIRLTVPIKGSIGVGYVSHMALRKYVLERMKLVPSMVGKD